MRDAFETEKQKGLNLDFETDFALIASKTTGVLTASLNLGQKEINLNPLSENVNFNAIKAAYISWAYLIRKSVCDFLDIESNEIDVGFHINKDKKAEIFIVEKLENGAGYCNYLSGRLYPEIPNEALSKPLLKDGRIYNILITEKHQGACSNSCYDCLRDFYNQKYHSQLDWRLGLDLAALANDKNIVIDFASEYWSEYYATMIKHLAVRFKGQIFNIAKGLDIIKRERDNILITHPF